MTWSLEYKQENKYVNELIKIVMQRYKRIKQVNVDSVVNMWATLDRVARRSFSKEATFEIIPREKRVSVHG